MSPRGKAMISNLSHFPVQSHLYDLIQKLTAHDLVQPLCFKDRVR